MKRRDFVGRVARFAARAVFACPAPACAVHRIEYLCGRAQEVHDADIASFVTFPDTIARQATEVIP